MRSAADLLAPIGAIALCYAAVAFAPHALRSASARRSSDLDAKTVQTSVDLIKAERWSDALPVTRTLSERFPRNHIYAQSLAGVYHHLSQPKEEAAEWERYLLTAPSPEEACPQIGDAYRQQGKLKEAADAYDRCLAFDTEDPQQIFY